MTDNFQNPRPDREAVARTLFERRFPTDDWEMAKQHGPYSDMTGIVAGFRDDADAILALLPAEPVQEMREGEQAPAVPDDVRSIKSAVTELLSHRGENPYRVLRGGQELWETWVPAFTAAIRYLPSEDGWRPHLDYAGEPMREGEFRDPPEWREERRD